MNLLAQIKSLMIQCQGRVGPYVQCNFCDLIHLLDNLKNIAFYVLTALVMAMALYGGFTMMLSSGNPAKFTQGRTIIVNALIGVAIVLSAYLIVSEIFRLLAPGGGFTPWNQIQC